MIRHHLDLNHFNESEDSIHFSTLFHYFFCIIWKQKISSTRHLSQEKNTPSLPTSFHPSSRPSTISGPKLSVQLISTLLHPHLLPLTRIGKFTSSQVYIQFPSQFAYIHPSSCVQSSTIHAVSTAIYGPIDSTVSRTAAPFVICSHHSRFSSQRLSASSRKTKLDGLHLRPHTSSAIISLLLLYFSNLFFKHTIISYVESERHVIL